MEDQDYSEIVHGQKVKQKDLVSVDPFIDFKRLEARNLHQSRADLLFGPEEANENQPQPPSQWPLSKDM